MIFYTKGRVFLIRFPLHTGFHNLHITHHLCFHNLLTKNHFWLIEKPTVSEIYNKKVGTNIADIKAGDKNVEVKFIILEKNLSITIK
jgi:hypothetical protein